jgi:polysaccharide pyruvyl transferase WcaK-like protein
MSFGVSQGNIMGEKTINKKKNILFSTTRQWNPGDEFILMGILNVMLSIDDTFNPIIFNRNPEIEHGRKNATFNFQFEPARMRFKRLKSGAYDNSFKDKFLPEHFIDLCVFAGTSEWASSRLKTFYEYIDRHAIPAVYLGIGAGSPDFNLKQIPKLYLDIIEKARLITVRDRRARDLLSEFGAVLLPCPALLAATRQYEKNLNQVKRVGLIYASHRAIKYNNISQATYGYMKALYERLISDYSEKFDFEFISHYVDELPEFSKDYSSFACNYSYDSRDYLEIYNKFDFIIGPRVHGIGLAASMGIPGINIGHDVRADTCEKFGAQILQVGCAFDGALELFINNVSQVASINKTLLENKHKTLQRYQDLLTPILKAL